nr:MAG TPA: hypothetical protein [Caudoviricetes sp.]
MRDFLKANLKKAHFLFPFAVSTRVFFSLNLVSS